MRKFMENAICIVIVVLIVFLSVALVLKISQIFYERANLVIPVKTDWVQELAKKNMQEYMECKQAQSYEYMKHHRQMIRNLIEQGKYDNKDSFPVESVNGNYDLIYYDIGGYSFQEDGTLFGSH